MKAVQTQQGDLSTVAMPEPVPGSGQVLVDVLRCGICGSDLHARNHCGHWGDTLARSGYAERVVVEESLILPVPNGLDTDLATLTEPMAVAWHAVQRGEVKRGDVALVIGCGPVGLAVICMLKARVVVVGVCMSSDQIEPAMGINKEIELRFVLGYTPLEFRDTLHMIADGKVSCAALITGTVGFEGVNNAFDALGDPEKHAKILIDPRSSQCSPD